MLDKYSSQRHYISTGLSILKYKKRKGAKTTPLPDFFIGAQAAVLGLDLLTRDVSRYKSYFLSVKLITL